MLLCDPLRDRGGLGGGVPMLARTFKEFMLWTEPCTGMYCGWEEVVMLLMLRPSQRGCHAVTP